MLWIIWTIAGAFIGAATYFFVLVISMARSGLGIAEYGSPLALAVVLFVVGAAVGAKFYPGKRRPS